MRTLIIAPHMDDEAISCGGLIQQRIKQGWEVKVIYVYGRVYDYGNEDGSAQEHEDFRKSVELLGVHRYSHPAIPLQEGEPGSSGFYPALQFVEDQMSQWKPHEVVGPSSGDLNQDHRHLSHVIDIALRPINQGNVIRQLEFIALDGTTQAPNYYIPLSGDMLQLKQDAIAAYSREARTGTSPRSPENLLAQARIWGAASGFPFAEAYKSKLFKEDAA